MGSIGDFVGDVIDTGSSFLGDVGNTIGDVAGSIGNAVGDVAGGIGDLVGSLDLGDALKAYVLSGGNPYAAAVAATNIDESLGFNPGSFLSGDLSSLGSGDIGGGGFNLEPFSGTLNNFLPTGPSLSDLNLGDIVDYSNYNPSIDSFDGPTITSGGYNPSIDSFDGPTITSGGYNPSIDSFDGPTIKSGGGYNPSIDSFDGPTITSGGGYNPSIDSFDGPTIKSGGGYNIGDVIKGTGDVIKGGLDKAAEWYKKYGNMAGTVGKLVSSYYAGKLSKQQQEELNKKIQAEYDAYNAKKSQFASQIASGSLPKLNISRGTYSPVRGYSPVYAADGGSIRGQYAGGGLTDLLASLTMPSMEDILGGFDKYGGPIGQLLKYGLSYGAGELSKKQQKELNQKLQAQYDKYNQEKSDFSNAISSGNLAKMNIQRGSTPVVAAARGGIMNVRPMIRSNLGIMGVNR
jgi:hypothetical protein